MAGERVVLDALAEIDQIISPEVLPAQRLELDGDHPQARPKLQ